MQYQPPWGRGDFGPGNGRVVRLFPDYAGSVLWFPHPVDYTVSCLDGGLVTDLIRWEIDYYDALDADFQWRTPAHAADFTAAGVALALRLALQLGSGFDVEFASYEPGVTTRRFRSELAPDNPRAAAAFTALAELPAAAHTAPLDRIEL
ncbi:hypothetical protein K2F54_12440 [Cryobacterium sp. 1639]|uniref:hypothetical protein n=1 Tax=Cryobacterium inferilacus TaxID=2866629 RepID=UPI001C729FEA|nr:hypothetical protein [Cryobacterium sp. 1639]MBX0300782.1 hypothetical protein [Cryobacterium sp. 1639]